MNASTPLILASASAARLGLLRSIGIEPDRIVPADIDETPLNKERPEHYVARIAKAKAGAIAAKHPEAIILAADTIAVTGRRIIQKAANQAEARAILTHLSGRTHRVLTGMCVMDPTGHARSQYTMTRVTFKRLSEEELERYLAAEHWQGKSGCYGIQGAAGAFIARINGSFSNVVGLPLVECRGMLLAAGLHHI